MSVTTIHLLHKKEFEPIVRPLENVAIFTPEGKYVFGQVVYLEPIQPETISLGSVSAADPTNYPTYRGMTELTDLELGKNEFAQYRLFVLDDILVEVYQPAALSRYMLKARPTRISVRSPNNFVELFVFEDKVPTIKYYAVTFRDIANARLLFYGFRYIIKRLEEKPKEFTVIPCSGVPPKVTE